ncbi:unnamed protein product, partial [Staurois parvus]
SWGPRAIGDHGAPVSLPKLKKAYEKSTRGISWGPLLTPGPWAVPEFPNGQSARVWPPTDPGPPNGQSAPGRVHVISPGPISTVQTEVRDPATSYSRMKTPSTRLTSARLDTDRSHKTALT